MHGGGTIDCIRGPYPMLPKGGIYRFGDNLAPKLPFTANIDERFSGLLRAMKRNDEPGLGQHAF